MATIGTKGSGEPGVILLSFLGVQAADVSAVHESHVLFRNDIYQ